MSVKGLNELVGRACISDEFRTGLMNGKRAELVRLPEFHLGLDETKALLAIKAETFADFAGAVERLMAQHESQAVRTENPFVVSLRWPATASARTGVYFRHQR